MSQITLTAGANPAFLSKSYINRDSTRAGDFVVTTGDAVKHRLYQMDFSAQWTSVGSDDTTTETITAGLYEGALQMSRSVDFIALMNVNLKNFLLQYSNDNGSTWTTVSGGDYQQGTADYAGTDLVLSLASPITANKLRLSMYRTQTANAQKLVGGFIAALGTFQAAKGMTKYEPDYSEGTEEVDMADGSTSFGHVYRSDNSFEFYRSRVGFRFVSSSERDSFRDVKNSVQAVLFYPEPGDKVRSLYLGKMERRSFKDPYSTTYKGAGYDIEFDFKEVGGG